MTPETPESGIPSTRRPRTPNSASESPAPLSYETVEGRYRLLSENSDDVVCVVDEMGCLRWVSPSVVRIWGAEPEALVGRELRDLIHPEDEQPWCYPLDGEDIQVASDRPDGSDEGTCEMRVLGGDGQWRWMRVRSDASVGPSEAQSRVITMRDIDADVKVRIALEEQRSELQLLADNASDVVYRAGPDRTIRWVSSNVSKTLGWSADELLGTWMSDIVHPDDRAATEPDRQTIYSLAMMPPGLAGGIIVRIRHRDGSYVWMSARATPVKDKFGNADGVVVGLGDVTDLVTAKAKAEAAARTADVATLSMDAAAIGMAITMPDGRFGHVNRAMCKMLGYSAAELENKTFSDITHPDDLAPGLDAVRELSAGRTDSFTQRKRYLTASGDVIWIDLAVSAVRDETQQLIHFVAQMVDVTAEVVNLEALRRSMERFRVLAENAADVVFETDTLGQFRWVAPSVRFVLGWEPDVLIGTKAKSWVHPQDLSEWDRQLLHAQKSSASVNLRARFRSSRGEFRHMAVRANAILDVDGTVSGVVVGLHDVTDQELVTHELARNLEVFRTAMLGSPVGIAIENANKRITEVNPALTRLLGVKREDLIGHTISDLLYADDVRATLEMGVTQLAGDANQSSHTHRLRGSRGPLWVEHTVAIIRADDGSPLLAIHQYIDQTEMRALQEHLEFKASHDPLTGLSNRTDLTHRLASALLPTGNEVGQCGGVLFCDVDNLKSINDTFGHVRGDQLLIEIAGRIAASTRPRDFVARYGGDEFVIVMRDVPNDDVLLKMAERIRSHVSGPVVVEGDEMEASISVGVTSTHRKEDISDVIDRADRALYQAKHHGRNRVEFLPPKAK